MVNWHRILVDLQRCGLDLRMTARLARVRYWPLYRVYRQDTSLDLEHAEGRAVIELWSVTTHRPVAEAPKLPAGQRLSSQLEERRSVPIPRLAGFR